jgi:c-di-GMP-binding flagellar brake protein YcgR
LKAIDRRRHQRFAALLNQEEQILIQYSAQSALGRIVNLSESGMLLELSSNLGLEIGAGASLLLNNGGAMFELRASVIRISRGLVGMQFIELTPADEKDLRNKVIRMQIIAARLETPALSR